MAHPVAKRYKESNYTRKIILKTIFLGRGNVLKWTKIIIILALQMYMQTDIFLGSEFVL